MDLREHGYDVVTAGSGQDAVAELQRAHFDLVLSDLSMEGMSGLELIEKAKKIDPELIAIILTGYGSLDSAIEALRLGADDYLLKPCNLSEMLVRIANCLEKQEISKKIKVYEKILPICCVCKKIRDDVGREPGKGEWMSYEQFLKRKTDLSISHGYCPECLKKTTW